MSLEKLIISVILFYANLTFACGTMCPEPDEFIVSGIVSDIKVVKPVNSPTKSDEFFCQISLRNVVNWKGRISGDETKVYTSWESQFCKNRFKLGEEMLFLSNPNRGFDWLKDTVGNDNYFVSYAIYLGLEKNSRITYLKRASKSDLSDKEEYCTNVLWRLCEEVDKTPVKFKIEHPAILEVSPDNMDEEGGIIVKLRYKIDTIGGIEFAGFQSPEFRSSKFYKKLKLLSEEFTFQNTQEYLGRCFFVTLRLNESAFEEELSTSSSNSN